MEISEEDILPFIKDERFTIDETFIEQFKKDEEAFEFKGLKSVKNISFNVKNDVRITFEFCSLESIFIDSCNFKSLSWRDCEFISESAAIIIMNCTIDTIELYKCNINADFEFLYISTCNFDSLHISRCTGNACIRLYEITFKSYFTVNSAILSRLDLSEVCAKWFDIAHSKIFGGLRLQTNRIKKISISDTYFPEKSTHLFASPDIEIDLTNIVETLLIQGNEFFCSSKISLKSDWIYISKTKWASLELEVNARRISIHNSSFSGTFLMDGLNIDDDAYKVKEEVIPDEDVSPKDKELFEHLISFKENAVVEEFSIHNTTFNVFMAKNIEIHKRLDIIATTFSSKNNSITGLTVKENSEVEFWLTTFQFFHFLGIDFSNMNIRTFNFVDSEFFSCKWLIINEGRINERYVFPHKTETMTLEAQRIRKQAYNLFAIHFQKKEDYSTAAKFYASQHEINISILKQEHQYFKLIILWIDKYLSYFGESISLPFYWLVILVLLFSWVFLFTGFSENGRTIEYNFQLNLNNLSITIYSYVNAILVSIQNLLLIGNKDFYLQIPSKFSATQIFMAVQKIIALVILWRFINAVNRFMKK